MSLSKKQKNRNNREEFIFGKLFLKYFGQTIINFPTLFLIMVVSIGFITTSSEKESDRIAKGLLEKHLVACTNIIPNVQSSFWWKGKIERKKESLLIVKTRKPLVASVIAKARQLHSYEVPAIEFFEAKASSSYEKFVFGETK